jgi:hypothetical protein
MSTSEEFYAARDARTLAYGVDPGILSRTVGIVVGPDAAGNPAAQATALALVNLLARVHRSLTLWVPDVELLAPAMVEATGLAEACEAVARAIDPHIQVIAAGPGDMSRPEPGVPSIAIGTDVPPGCTVYLGAERFLAAVDDHPVPISAAPFSVLGGGLAACLAAGELMRALYGHPSRSRRASLWNLGEGDAAEAGPALGMSPIDVGDVAVIGAGAVGSAFAYWMRQLGHVGHWVVVDHDRAELHNTNRCLGMIAADAGWAAGSPRGAPAGKAELAASLMDAEAYDGWYHEWVSLPGRRPDLVLPLANEFDVRRAIGQRGEPVLIHATTSPNWTAELHRHLAGRDGCIDCRLPQAATGAFRCATGPLPESPTASQDSGAQPDRRPDAALPFLSAAAGLLLLTALIQLEHGVFPAHQQNHWRLLFGPGPRVWSRSTHLCVEGCQHELAPEIREILNQGRRWAHLG